MLISLGLADRINYMRKALTRLNVNLEDLVRQRTDQLSAANAELASLNRDLVESHEALWGEMRLAKKIQTVLLPKQPGIPGYDVVAHTQPADDVGGLLRYHQCR